jgi:hypothetical protein
MDGYYCVQTQLFTGFVSKEDVKLDLVAYKLESNLSELSVSVGDVASLSEIEMSLLYTDGTSVLVNDYDFSAIDLSSPGEKYITFTYGDFTTYVKVTVNEPKITEINLISMPSKSVYAVGESFDRDGLVIEGVFSDGSKMDITNLASYTYSFDESGSSIVLIEYCGYKIAIPVTVYEMPTVEIFNAEAYVGQTVILPLLYLSEDTQISPTSFSATITFNSEEIEFVGVENIGALSEQGLSVIVGEDGGRITVSYSGESIIAANEALVNLRFNILNFTGDEEFASSEINIESFELTDSLGYSFNCRAVNGYAYSLGQLTVAYVTEVSGEDFALSSVNYSENAVIIDAIPQKEGYIFAGWSIYGSGDAVTYNAGDVIELSENICLYAVWEKESEKQEQGAKGCKSSLNDSGFIAFSLLFALSYVVIISKKEHNT